MRKILCLLFCFGLIFALAACNLARYELNSESASPSESEESTNSPVPTESEEGNPSDIPPSGNETVEVTEQPSASPTESTPAEKGDDDSTENVMSINITVGSTTFEATLNDNETTQALVAQFPMTLQMNELNGQEKYYHLSENLPAESTERPATIHDGDIMYWSGNTLVLFYKTYSNSYGGYVPLGRVGDPSNLASALGSDNVQVTWSLAD